MTSIYVTGSRDTITLASGDLLVVGSTGIVASNTTNPVVIQSTGYITNNGVIAAGSGYYAINSSNSTGFVQITNGPTGVISGGANLYAGVLYVTNNGTMDSLFNLAGNGYNSIGLQDSSQQGSVLNNGSISGQYGVYVSGTGKHILINNGTIDGGSVGVAASVANSSGSFVIAGAFTLTNTGKISGVNGGLSLGSELDTVVNSGSIVGAVSLGAGDDSLDNRGGAILGVISGGQGSDTINGGAGGETIYGDNVSGDTTGGLDILYGNGGDDVMFGGYGADALYGNTGDDVLYGNQDNDWMHGGQGNDVLYGGQGDDTLNGGVGDDVLTGGVGNDTFVFAPGFGHDTVVDFGNGADVMQFQPGTFANFADVQAHATQLAGGVLLTDATGDTVYIVGATTGGLTSAQFAFG